MKISCKPLVAEMILGIIPARYASTRFPGKPLADIGGKSMIQCVYEQAKKSRGLAGVIVATDHRLIFDHVKKFGGEAVMTSSDHTSGTDRCYEAFQKTPGDFSYVINIQGDEPFIAPSQVDLLAGLCDEKTEIATLMIPVKTEEELNSESEVKIAVNNKLEALYFSRSVIPYQKNTEKREWHKKFNYYRHVGIYAYRADVLEKITALPPSALEQAESLEQLRWLENGYRIKLAVTEHDSHCIDAPEDIERVMKLMKK